MPTHRALLRRGALAALLLTIGLAAAACGGGSSSSGATSTTTASGTGATGANAVSTAAMARYTACLKQHGVTMPSGGGAPPGGGAGGTPPTGTNAAPPTGTTGGTRPAGGPQMTAAQRAGFQKATTACASVRPSGLRFGPGGGNGGQNSAAFAAYRNCLQLHGVKAAAVLGPAGATLTATQQKAVTACASLRPARQAPNATTTTTTAAN